MKVVLMCGSHKRHMYIAKRLKAAGYLAGMVVEQREAMVPQPPENLCELDRNNFMKHFKDRDLAENKFFGNIDADEVMKGIPVLKVSMQELNSAQVISFLKQIKADKLFSYGVHKIDKEILDLFPESAFNIHGGLSPWYRGNITLFWPLYFLRPNWAGMTIHYLSDYIDAGDIVHHSVPVLEHGDKVHDVACKAVWQVGIDLCKIVKMMEDGETLPRVSQGHGGKLFVGSDWTPQHLRLVYNTFDNKVVDEYLDGKIDSPEPKLVRAFS